MKMIFYKTLIQSIEPTRSHLARKRFALTKIFEKKSVSRSTLNALKRIEMQKKFTPLTDYALCA